MFKKILGKKEQTKGESKEFSEALSKVQNMNLTEMRIYVNNKIASFPVSTYGLLAVMEKLTLENKTTNKLYLEESDTDVKKKKAFDLVLLVAKSTKINLKVLDMVEYFTKVYAPIIAKFDKDNKEIYTSRFQEMHTQALAALAVLADDMDKEDILR